MNPVTVTPSATRYHRRALGLTQSGLAQAADVSTSYVKSFESERLRPSPGFLKKLFEFFTSKDIKPEKLAAEYSNGGVIDAAPRAREGRMSGMATLPQIHIESRQCFYIAPSLPDALVDEFMSRWEKNEDRIAELFRQRVESGIFDKYSGQSEAALMEVFALLAENFVLFKLLTGWDLLENGKAIKADTVAAIIATQYADVIKAKKVAIGDVAPQKSAQLALVTNDGEENQE